MGKTLLLIQFIVHFISFIVIIILAVLNYLQKKNFENSVLCFVIFMYLTIVILVTLNIFGSLNSGPHFSNVLLFGFILEIALFSILLFSKFWILIQQKETLIFASSQQQLKIANTLLQSQKMERQKIGEELKTNLQFFISQSQQTLLQENKNTSSVPFQKIKELLIQSKEEIKRIHNNILPSVANGEGLLKSIQNLCGEINNSKALKVRCDFYNITSTFSEFQRINLYRILQELLNNVVKHADATQAKVVMEQAENQIKMIVEDNGKGLGIHEAGLLENGFNSIKNRTQSMNGKLNFSKSKLGGLRVVIEIPV